jgi:hypothetical protein
MMTDNTLRLVRLAIGVGVVLTGWLLIIAINGFHVTPPVVFVCLGYLAVVAAIYNLFRTGASAVAPEDPDDDFDSTHPQGEIELEREKRALLKAIKEAEFDQQMGKLSKRDADEMIALYRMRAIEVIKELDGGGGSVRDEILREVRARIELEDKAKKKAASDADKKQAKKKKKAQAEPAAEEPVAEDKKSDDDAKEASP